MRKLYDFSKGIKNPYIEKFKQTCWKRHNDNMCCCNCKYQMDLCSHPCVDGKSITNKVGYVCTWPISGRKIVLNCKHGFCEVWESAWNSMNQKVDEGNIELKDINGKKRRAKAVNGIIMYTTHKPKWNAVAWRYV